MSVRQESELRKLLAWSAAAVLDERSAMAGGYVCKVLPCFAMHAALMPSDLAAQDSLLDIMVVVRLPQFEQYLSKVHDI